MITIKKMEEKHVPQIAELEKKIFADPWSEESFWGELQNPLACYFVAEKEDEVLGYGGVWSIAKEGNITNIAVKEHWRGKKIAGRILDALISYAKEQNFAFLTLEVRVSNESAKRLYSSKGFCPVGIRKGYYADNHEDALLMTLDWRKQNEDTGD